MDEAIWGVMQYSCVIGLAALVGVRWGRKRRRRNLLPSPARETVRGNWASYKPWYITGA
jgi:hypothetical protein